MRILFISPDIEGEARGINAILKSLIISAKEDGHDVSLLVGYPKSDGVKESEVINSKVEHLQLRHYIRDGKKSFKYVTRGGITRRNLLKAALRLKFFKVSRMKLNQDLISDKEPLLRNVDEVVVSPYFYQLLSYNFKKITRRLIKKITKEYDFDLVVVASPSILRSKDVTSGKIVHFVHDTMPIDLIEAPPDNNTPARYAKQFYSTCTESDLVLTNSKDTAERVEEVNKDANIHVLYGTTSSRKKDIEPSSIVKSRGFKEKGYLLFASTVEKRKNVTTLMDAFSLVADKTELDLVIVGGKGYGFKEIKAKYNSLNPEIQNRVHMLGYVSESDKYALYDNAFAFVFPSIYEGMGLVIVEAMQAGIPVITTNSGALPEAGGDAALYIEDPYNPNEISDAILKLKNDPKLVKTMVEKGGKVKDKFTHEKFRARFTKAIESIE